MSTITNYRDKVMGCWLGKAAGGTLGQPYEGCDGPLELDYYNPVPTDMIPNDDLDLQVLWAYVLDKNGKVDRDAFADAWLTHVAFPWDEYGIAIRNLRNGIKAPACGMRDNWFKDGLGAAIRSEIWACLAPGNPELATRYAYEDACVDHYDNGLYAEQFLAALESAAFVNSNINELIDIGLKYIPAQSRLAQAIRDTIRWCDELASPLKVREKILTQWGNENFTDCVMNLPFVIMALLMGKGDFSASVCLAVNCGRDADCTTATVGAILGIIAPDAIDEKWLKPIGRKLVINKGITGISHPDTLDEFTDLVIDLKDRISLRRESDAGIPVDVPSLKISAQCGTFGPWFPQDEGKFTPKLPADTETIVFDGTFGSIPAEKIPADNLFMMRFKFRLRQDRKVRIMFNSHANNRVWIDGQYAFGRESGRMAPSFHRCPQNQFKDMELCAGEHEFLVGIAPSGDESKITWCIGVGSLPDLQWIADAFI